MNAAAIETTEVKKPVEKSSIPMALYITGALIFLVGLIAGYQIGELQYSFLTGERNWLLTLGVWIASGCSAMFFIGFGETIDMLIKIYNKQL